MFAAAHKITLSSGPKSSYYPDCVGWSINFGSGLHTRSHASAVAEECAYATGGDCAASGD